MNRFDQQLDKIYGERFSGTEASRDRVWQILTSRWFQRWVDPAGSVLDLGAGYCEFINNIEARRKFALDLNPMTMQKAAPSVKVLSQSVTDCWPLASGCIDVVFTSNFLEHLQSKQDLQFCLAEAHRALRAGGRFIAMGPNIRFCYDVYWDFIDHFIPLSDRSLAEALTTAGFAPEVIIPRFLPYTMAGKQPSAVAVRVYLALPFAWRVFGKQFLLVFRKMQ